MEITAHKDRLETVLSPDWTHMLSAGTEEVTCVCLFEDTSKSLCYRVTSGTSVNLFTHAAGRTEQKQKEYEELQ